MENPTPKSYSRKSIWISWIIALSSLGMLLGLASWVVIDIREDKGYTGFQNGLTYKDDISYLKGQMVRINLEQTPPNVEFETDLFPLSERIDYHPKVDPSLFEPQTVVHVDAHVPHLNLISCGGPFEKDPTRTFRNRFSPHYRSIALKSFGGNGITEEAVANGLNWLSSQQNANGSWGKDYKAAVTGLVLLAFPRDVPSYSSWAGRINDYIDLNNPSRPHPPVLPNYLTKVSPGIEYLIELRSENNGFMFTHSRDLEHDIATYALGEAYIVLAYPEGSYDGLPILNAFEQSVDELLENPRITGSTSLASLCKIHSIELRSLHKRKTRKEEIISKDLEKTSHHSGIAILAKQITWKLSEEKPLLATKNNHSGDAIDMFIATQACFHLGGEIWKQWNKQMLHKVLPLQQPDGSWKNWINEKYDLGLSDHDSQLFSTALSVLTLQSYYRYGQNFGNVQNSFRID